MRFKECQALLDEAPTVRGKHSVRNWLLSVTIFPKCPAGHVHQILHLKIDSQLPEKIGTHDHIRSHTAALIFVRWTLADGKRAGVEARRHEDRARAPKVGAHKLCFTRDRFFNLQISNMQLFNFDNSSTPY